MAAPRRGLSAQEERVGGPAARASGPLLAGAGGKRPATPLVRLTPRRPARPRSLAHAAPKRARQGAQAPLPASSGPALS